MFDLTVTGDKIRIERYRRGTPGATGSFLTICIYRKGDRAGEINIFPDSVNWNVTVTEETEEQEEEKKQE